MLLPFSKALAEERGPDKRIVLNNRVRPDGQGGVNGNGMIRTACRADFLCSEKRQERRIVMENRIALLGIIVENKEVTDRLNDILHEYADYVVGRMGIPYRERGISIISVVLDAPESAVSALVRQAGECWRGFLSRPCIPRRREQEKPSEPRRCRIPPCSG